MEALKKFEEAVETYVRPMTFPVAIKLLKREVDIPKGIKTARQFYGHRIAMCQAWAMARHNGQAVALLKDDNICPIPIMSHGLAETPEFFLSGRFYIEEHGRYSNDYEMAARYAREMPRFPAGEYVGLVTAPVQSSPKFASGTYRFPVENCNFEPDMVMVFCNPLQLMRFIGVVFHREGRRFETSIWPYGICTLFVQVQHTGRCQLGIPCYGSRQYDAPAFDEVIFMVPAAKLEEVALGLKFTHEHGIIIPPRRFLDYEPARPWYKKLRDML